MQQPLPLRWQHWVQSTGAQVPISGTSHLLCTGYAEDMEQLWHMRTQAWRTNHSPVLSITTITQGIDYSPLPQLRVSHRDLYTRTADFLAAFSTTLDVVDTSQMTKKHSWPCKRDPQKTVKNLPHHAWKPPKANTKACNTAGISPRGEQGAAFSHLGWRRTALTLKPNPGKPRQLHRSYWFHHSSRKKKKSMEKIYDRKAAWFMCVSTD